MAPIDNLTDNNGAREAAVNGARSHTKAVRSVSLTAEQPDAGFQIRGLFNQYSPLAYMLPWDVLDYIELLATYNPDYSQAVENIKMLANTGHTLFVGGKKRTARRVKDRLDEKARLIQQRHGGIDGLVEKLLDQAAVYGAVAGEWILTDELDDVIDFADVNPKTIRFFWEDEHWAPYQKLKGNALEEAKKRGQKIRSGCAKLNELTFVYHAFDSAPGFPYGTPPFLAALSNIAIQRDMVHNMAQIVKKIGLLGVIDLVVKALPMRAGETQEAYESRAGAYLDAYVKVIEDMVKEGGVVHYDDVEAKTYQIGGNAAGATNIFKQNEELIFSGLKSMPSLQGRSFSTTETYAGVAYEITLRNVHKYQRAIKRILESGYWLMCTMWGEDPSTIKVTFNNNRALNRLQDAQAEKSEIDNAIMLWVIGLLDQEGVAQRLGFSNPATDMEEPPEEAIRGKRDRDSEPAVSDSGTTEVDRAIMEKEGKIVRETGNEESDGEAEGEEGTEGTLDSTIRQNI